MRRALSFVPLVPVVVACALFGCDALMRDLSARAYRAWEWCRWDELRSH